MTTNLSKDYYDILGVPKNATPEQIKQRYRKLMKENHPDRFTGTRKKYEQTGDPDLLKIIDEKIAQANEATQQINEAYDVLSDPSKRAAHDRTRGSASTSTASAPPPRPKPEIVLSTTNLSFGSVTKGDNKTRSFTIDSHSGMPEEIHIDWETVPSWGELVIEPHPTHTFPIKVTVEVKTGKVATGSHTGRIVVIVDGEEFGVSVSVKVVVPAPAPTPVSPRPKTTTAPSRPRPKPAPAPVYTPPPATPTKIPWGILIVVVVIMGIIGVIIAQASPPYQAPSITIMRTGGERTTDEAFSSQGGCRMWLLFSVCNESDPVHDILWGQYTITNNGTESVTVDLSTENSLYCLSTEDPYSYTGVRLDVGKSISVVCVEYYKNASGEQMKDAPCITANDSKQSLNICADATQY